MKDVLDASVAVKWVLPEPDSAKALTLWDELDDHVSELLVPDTLPVEIAHALTRVERGGLLLPGEAGAKLNDVVAAGIDLRSDLPLLARAVGLSSQWRIGVCDCLYVAPADQERCELITADNRLLNVVQGQIPVILLSAM